MRVERPFSAFFGVFWRIHMGQTLHWNSFRRKALYPRNEERVAFHTEGYKEPDLIIRLLVFLVISTPIAGQYPIAQESRGSIMRVSNAL
jgi:hypothetical protein